ncbi:hypothetical protein N0V93_008851 [Gnomoniopsis smithogilvyi]|uniref:Pectinesterase n=1 Tax=Gnomoniopsis smithogilvyi TaxID=1191159 RepID=A0A9W8YNT6_9PEZI|nr:hypothetical protein N0V93_008851 [Gnomoniopsis smithogilvyi]
MSEYLLSFLALAILAPSHVSGICTGPNTRTTPPVGAIVVDATGAYNGSFSSANAAVATLRNQTASQTLFFMPGVYEEQILISPLEGPLVLQGYTCDSTSYADNEVTITHALAQKDIPDTVTGETRNDLTSTVRFKSANTKVYNLNIANTAGNVGQALAINVNATNQAFYGCNFTGYQDTVLADKGRQLYVNSFISGATDFIFGRYAQAWFESCDLESIGPGYITASGRESANSSAIYVFNNAKVTGTSGTASTYLGRPWRRWAQVVFQNSNLSDVVSPQGWAQWDNSTSTDEVIFQEFKNSGAGADTTSRVAFSSQRDAAVVIADVLGAGFETEEWIDMTYL